MIIAKERHTKVAIVSALFKFHAVKNKRRKI